MSLMEIYNTDTPNGKEVELAKAAYLDQQPGPSPLRTYNNSRAHGPGFSVACSRLYRSLPTPVSHPCSSVFQAPVSACTEPSSASLTSRVRQPSPPRFSGSQSPVFSPGELPRNS
jgi:hypothetical protein